MGVKQLANLEDEIFAFKVLFIVYACRSQHFGVEGNKREISFPRPIAVK